MAQMSAKDDAVIGLPLNENVAHLERAVAEFAADPHPIPGVGQGIPQFARAAQPPVLS